MHPTQRERDALRARKTKNKRDQRARIAKSGNIEKTVVIPNNADALVMLNRAVKRICKTHK